MGAIPIVGKCFPLAADFLSYLDDIKFGAWRPRFVTMHHTGGPSLATWKTYNHGNRKVPITDEQWMRNLAAYYGNELGWSAGPHFFFTPDNFCALSLPDRRGVHAVSFNANSWGVECVGDFDSEAFTPDLANRYAQGLACLHLATGLSPENYQFNASGLHFHRDDPKTKKTCPGRKVDKLKMVDLVRQHMTKLSDSGAHDDDDPPPPVELKPGRIGIVNVAENDFLNVRDEPSGKSPVTRVLHRGDTVMVIGDTNNAGTPWLKIQGDDYVAARFITLSS